MALAVYTHLEAEDARAEVEALPVIGETKTKRKRAGRRKA